MMVKCRCKCGNELYVNAYTLKSGQSKMCRRCFGNARQGKDNPNYTGFENVPGSLLYRMRKRAKTSKMTFLISNEYLNSLYISQNGKCAITNLTISFKNKTASLDRISSSKGYEEGNVWWVHKDVNIMKNGYELEYFVFICRRVAKLKCSTQNKTEFNYGK